MIEDNFVTELPIQGMDCADCARHVRAAIQSQPGVDSVEVYLAAEKAVIQSRVDLDLREIRRAVKKAGYEVSPAEEAHPSELASPLAKTLFIFFGAIFGLVLVVAVFGEGFGLLDSLNTRIPWPVWLALIILLGFPVFQKVLRAALNRTVLSHTLMTVGVLAAAAVGEWATALVVVFFMRVGDFIETYTTERAGSAVRKLDSLAPKTARIEEYGIEFEIDPDQVQLGDTVIVRPGEIIPADGMVIGGQAWIDQSKITGESMLVEAGPGATVFAATIAHQGALRIQAGRSGKQSAFSQVIRLVEQAEANRAEVERTADRFSTYFLPIVAGIAGLTLIASRDPLAASAVLVVACSCAFTLATPIAMLASIGSGARRGLLIKGGKYLEVLADADVLLIDKTGTLTLGRPQITSIRPLNGVSENELLSLAASAERYAEHPLASAVRQAARGRELALGDPESFESIPGIGVKAMIGENEILVGGERLVREELALNPQPVEIQVKTGETLIYIIQNSQIVGVLTAADSLRPEVPEALEDIRSLGIENIELLTGDHSAAAAQVAGPLGIRFRAGLTPQEKIEVVCEYQSEGKRVVMIGDGVNDAPALAQADVGIAMGAAGSEVAVEAAHIALMKDDWRLVPDVFRISYRTMRVVRGNLAFTAIYNVIGISLAALGILPPGLAAAAQSIPDLGMLGNSSRLLRKK